MKQEFNMNLSFENKVALVTGAGSGMGLVTAKAFAEAGAALAPADVNEKAVRSAAEEPWRSFTPVAAPITSRQTTPRRTRQLKHPL